MNAVQPVLSLNRVSSGYGESIVVRNVSLTVASGEIFALLGKNGMGKSTLLKTVMGFLPLQNGTIHLMGKDVSDDPPHHKAKRGVAYGPQEQAIFPDLTVRENVILGTRDDSEFDGGLERICELFPFMQNRLAQRAGTLSGGEQKMLILSRALMARPKLILIDEISEGLQPSVIDRLATAFLEERKRTGVAILLVEQHIPFALAVADRWAVLKLGEIDDEGASSEASAPARIADHLAVI